MKNYIINGDFAVRFQRTPVNEAVIASTAFTPGWVSVPGGPDELVSYVNVNGWNPLGYAPKFGGGPGGGGVLTSQILDRSFGDTRWVGNPSRLLYLGWTQMPNAADNSQSSGWEAGAVNADGSPRHTVGSDNPWRVTILEHGLRNCEELLGGWVGYSFFAFSSGGAAFPIRPLIPSFFKANDYMLHDLQHEAIIPAGGSFSTEVCGFFQLPPIPAGKTVVRSEFGSAFDVDTTLRTPGTLLMHDFKLGFFGYDQPTMPAQEIKRHVEHLPLKLQRLAI
jgi:hypothetical protein